MSKYVMLSKLIASLNWHHQGRHDIGDLMLCGKLSIVMVKILTQRYFDQLELDCSWRALKSLGGGN